MHYLVPAVPCSGEFHSLYLFTVLCKVTSSSINKLHTAVGLLAAAAVGQPFSTWHLHVVCVYMYIR